MRELPALFSTPMVQALLENRKRMTRRTAGLEKVNENPEDWTITEDQTAKGILCFNKKGYSDRVKPRYNVGDHIWIRESYYAYGFWKQTGEKTKTGLIEMEFIDTTIESNREYIYDPNTPNKILNYNAVKEGIKGWFRRSGLFMPKAASRITLECTGVRCERLQDITKEDAIAEGVEMVCDYGETGYKDYTRPDEAFSDIDAKWSFETLWESINGKDSWLLNPWVFVYEFKRIEKP